MVLGLGLGLGLGLKKQDTHDSFSINQHSENQKAFHQYNLVKTENPYSNHSIYWCSSENDFCSNNGPNRFNHEQNIKKHIIVYAVSLPKNYGIIDCGAHIGDGAIPIADALIQQGRGDITVYAIEPSPDKCSYIRSVARINNLHNIQVICYGLTDRDGAKYSHAVDEDWLQHKNTGGIRWHDIGEEHKVAKNQEKIQFIKLDTLVSKGIINRPIGYIHFDVEGMEPQTIQGGIGVFSRDKPILSAETHTQEAQKAILKILSPLGYRFLEKIGGNSIFNIS